MEQLGTKRHKVRSRRTEPVAQDDHKFRGCVSLTRFDALALQTPQDRMFDVHPRKSFRTRLPDVRQRAAHSGGESEVSQQNDPRASLKEVKRGAFRFA